jgi:hypothetical protein
MQLHLALIELTNPPPSQSTPINRPSWEQIDAAARMTALELLARLIASTLGTPREDRPDE